MKNPKHVHLTLQGKGGVGKSFVSSLIAQKLIADGQPVQCLDTDPVNATLSGYGALGAKRVELMKGATLDPREFDGMMEMIVETDANFVVDNGASSFIPLSHYLIENDAFSVIAAAGKVAVVHTVVTGGQGMVDTLSGFQSLATQLPPDVPLIVWLNEYFGPIEAKGKTFEEMRVYVDNKDRVAGLVRIPAQTSATFGRDMQEMLEHRLTFGDVENDERFGLMARQRMKQVRGNLFAQMTVTLP